jgi:hypothetical protein
VSPAENHDLSRWMGRIEEKVDRLQGDVAEEKEGSANYRRDMRARMEAQDHSLADLDRDVGEVKKLGPVVQTLRDDRLKQRGAMIILAGIGGFGGTVLAAVAAAVILWLFRLPIS